jgi:hypothetical protein
VSILVHRWLALHAWFNQGGSACLVSCWSELSIENWSVFELLIGEYLLHHDIYILGCVVISVSI